MKVVKEANIEFNDVVTEKGVLEFDEMIEGNPLYVKLADGTVMERELKDVWLHILKIEKELGI